MKCGATMRVVAFIDDPIVVRRILDPWKRGQLDSEPARASPPKEPPRPQGHDDFYPDPPWEDRDESYWPVDDQVAG